MFSKLAAYKKNALDILAFGFLHFCFDLYKERLSFRKWDKSMTAGDGFQVIKIAKREWHL